ncbi:MAG TPA: phage head-tail connector protein [Thermomonas sp.]|nr:phage head-tail connector protein [Thermomonas sp.]
MLRVVTAASDEPISVDAVKAHLRVTHAVDDDLLAAQITSAREHVEQFSGVAMTAASYVWHPDAVGQCGWRPFLPLYPAVVSEVSYYDGEARVIAAEDDFRFDEDRGDLTLGTWAEVAVEFETAPGEIPVALLSAIKLRVQAEYEAGAEDAERLRAAANRIAWPWRRVVGV